MFNIFFIYVLAISSFIELSAHFFVPFIDWVICLILFCFGLFSFSLNILDTNPILQAISKSFDFSELFNRIQFHLSILKVCCNHSFNFLSGILSKLLSLESNVNLWNLSVWKLVSLTPDLHSIPLARFLPPATWFRLSFPQPIRGILHTKTK